MGSSWRDDARFAWRRLWTRPLGAAASVLTLACAIGAGSATWSLLSSLLLHPLPVEAPERLFAVIARMPMRDGGVRASSHFLYPDYQAIRDSGAFAGLAAGGTEELLVGAGAAAVPQRRTVVFVSYDYFDTLGIRMQAGRTFTRDEDQRGMPVPVVISERFWRAALNGESGAIGQELTFTTRARADAPTSVERATVVGIAPRGFRGLDLATAPDVYVPLHAIATLAAGFPNPFFDKDAGSSPSSWIGIVGRIDDEQSVAQIATRLEQLGLGPGATFDLMPVNTAAIPESARAGMVRFTSLLATTVGLLLLIGSLTVGVLLLVRTEARRDELAMCLALGGTRRSLVRGIVFEAAMLSAAGAALAIPVAAWLFSGVRTFQLPGAVDLDLLGLSIDRRVWMACAAGAVVTTLMTALLAGAFGFAPGADVLRSRAGGTPRVTRRRTRAMLVIAQVAVTLVLVAGAGLFARSLAEALTINSGFDARRIVTAVVALDGFGYMPARAASFLTELRERLVASPAIDSVSLIQREGAMTPAGRIVVNGEPRQFRSLVAYMAIDEHYFSTMGIRLVAGRDFSGLDTRSSPLVAIVSESFARELGRGRNPLGMRLTETSWRPPDGPAIAEVVGVVPDVITSVRATEPLAVYYSLAQREPRSQRTVVVRARGETPSAAAAINGAIRQLDPGVEPGPVSSIEEQLAQQMSPQRLAIFVLGGLGAIAVLLTLLGAYVVADSMASTRGREMSIRAALGARRVQLGALILRETVVLVGTGIVAGLALAWLGANSIRAFLFRVEPLIPQPWLPFHWESSRSA